MMIQYTAIMEGYQSCYIISAFVNCSFISGAAVISSSYRVSTPSSTPLHWETTSTLHAHPRCYTA